MKETNIKKRINKIFEKNKYSLYPEIPKNILVELSNACNCQCIFCSNSKMTRKIGVMNFDFLCNLLQQAYDLGVREVGFYTTGEPLTYPKLVDAIDYSKKIGYEYIYITTNGVLASIDYLKKLINAGLDSIKFSINAINKDDYYFIHGTDRYDQVMKNLKELYKYKMDNKLDLKVFVSYISTQYTDYKVDDIKHHFESFCDDIIVVNVRNQSGLMPMENEILKCKSETGKIQSNRVIPCHYLFGVINVSYEGYLTACCTDYQNYLAYCDLNKCSIKEGWNNEIITNLRKEHLTNKLTNNLCYNCIVHCDSVPKPLKQDLATIFDEQLICPSKKFYLTINERNKRNGKS